MAIRIASLVSGLLVLSTMPAVFAERNLTRPPGTTRYAGMVDQLQCLGHWDRNQGYHRIQLSRLGSSVNGRSIWMETLHDPSTRPAKKIFYLCRQHGHEPASTEGALRFVDELVHAAPVNDLAQCLSNVTVYIIPMANPDGAERFLRHNAHNVDLNRAWLSRPQPETRALWHAIEEIHPDLITDQHELYPTDRRPNFTETAGPHAGAAADTAAVCEATQTVVH